MADAPSNTDDAKGRVKEAAGKLTGDKSMENEGKLDQAEGKIKEGVDNIADKARNLLHKDKD